MNPKRIFIAALLSLLLAGCGMGKTPPCPQTGLISGVSTITLFYPGEGQEQKNIVSRAAIVDYKGECKFSKGQLALDLDLSIYAELGHEGQKAPRQKAQQYPYFVAILDPNEKILLRKSFTAQVSFGETENSGATVESLRQTIPMGSAADAARYKVLFGFQLSPQQLEYNRNRHQL